MRSRAVLGAFTALALALPCLFTSCPLDVEAAPMTKEDFYGGWVYEEEDSDLLLAFHISEEDIIDEYAPSSFYSSSTSITQWDRRRNPYFDDLDDFYPEGFKMTLGNGSLFHVMYLHANKQSLLIYQPDYPGYEGTNWGHRIYVKGDLNNPDDGVQKSITITDFPVNDFGGHGRSANVTVIDFLNRTVASSGAQSLSPAITFDLQKNDARSPGPWTETGSGYTIWLRVIADSYRGESSGGFWFTYIKNNNTFSGPVLEIPFRSDVWTTGDFFD